ncbi:hypothetical protein MKZ38_006888 [Zalerion maritima]|uniref:Uncharacterized protein n=1 Tax=Zalerion maritima TaxID=339359 RepID=A0AAD5WN82_9PEZI|nr:hypothetical protein MKZ38_006888 [Zalerion maritima]
MPITPPLDTSYMESSFDISTAFRRSGVGGSSASPRVQFSTTAGTPNRGQPGREAATHHQSEQGHMNPTADTYDEDYDLFSMSPRPSSPAPSLEWSCGCDCHGCKPCRCENDGTTNDCECGCHACECCLIRPDSAAGDASTASTPETDLGVAVPQAESVPIEDIIQHRVGEEVRAQPAEFLGNVKGELHDAVYAATADIYRRRVQADMRQIRQDVVETIGREIFLEMREVKKRIAGMDEYMKETVMAGLCEMSGKVNEVAARITEVVNVVRGSSTDYVVLSSVNDVRYQVAELASQLHFGTAGSVGSGGEMASDFVLNSLFEVGQKIDHLTQEVVHRSGSLEMIVADEMGAVREDIEIVKKNVHTVPQDMERLASHLGILKWNLGGFEEAGGSHVVDANIETHGTVNNVETMVEDRLAALSGEVFRIGEKIREALELGKADGFLKMKRLIDEGIHASLSEVVENVSAVATTAQFETEMEKLVLPKEAPRPVELPYSGEKEVVVSSPATKTSKPEKLIAAKTSPKTSGTPAAYSDEKQVVSGPVVVASSSPPSPDISSAPVTAFATDFYLTKDAPIYPITAEYQTRRERQQKEELLVLRKELRRVTALRDHADEAAAILLVLLIVVIFVSLAFFTYIFFKSL